MGEERRDPVTGRKTTGHEWNGIEELDTPIPRVVLFFLAAGVIFSVIYWLLMPAWPTGWSYTKGLLGLNDRAVVMGEVEAAAAERTRWTSRIESAGFDQIRADPELMRHVMDTGSTLFADNCAVCHGVSGTGGPGFPDLTAGAWLWGGEPEVLMETIRVGINSTTEGSRVSQMMAFGRDGILNDEQVRSVASYVRSLSGQSLTPAETERLPLGGEVYVAQCAVCHGPGGEGGPEVGAPRLTDDVWLYGGDAQSVRNSIHRGRQGHMPHWDGRLSSVDMKILAVYVGALGRDAP